LGRDASSECPPVQWSWRVPSLALRDALLKLATRGHWLQEAHLLETAGWSSMLPGHAVTELLIADRADGLAGIWTGADGQAIRAVLYKDARIWTEDHARAEAWLLTILGYPVD
jgi:hypothetical protein